MFNPRFRLGNDSFDITVLPTRERCEYFNQLEMGWQPISVNHPIKTGEVTTENLPKTGVHCNW